MWTLSLNNFRRAFLSASACAFLLALGAVLPNPAGATNIDKITILFTSTNKNYTAGVATNTAGGQFLINCFINSNQVPDATGEVMTVDLVKSGVAQTYGMPDTSFTI